MAQNSPPPSLQELNRRADLLAARAKLFFSGSTHRSSSQSQNHSSGSTLIGHRPHPDLEGECWEITTNIKQLQSDCCEFPEPPVIEDEESPLGLLLKERRLQAELEIWKKQRPSVFCRDPLTTEEDTVWQVQEWGDELQKTLKVVREERENLTKELEREKQLLDETRLIKEALEMKKDGVEHERSNSQQPANSHTDSAEERLEKMEEYCSMLRESLQAFVDDHLIQSSEDLPTTATAKRSRQRQRNRAQSREGDVEEESHPDLVDIIQTLISKCLDTPKDPYISSETIWPPHFQLLLRSWVIERHPTKPTLVRLTPFHAK